MPRRPILEFDKRLRASQKKCQCDRMLPIHVLECGRCGYRFKEAEVVREVTKLQAIRDKTRREAWDDA